ncbi:MAG: hypothetical protein ACD_13C00203G0002 [uncultured bacterium]|nr:MAG: hypothetical protein ACD_13C00203G0002 [uncultured bacterium]
MALNYDAVRKLKTQIAAKAWGDSQFRAELEKNPKAAMEKLLGQSLPPEVEIKLAVDDPNTLNIVIPEKIGATGELSEDELASVSGGGWGCFCFCDCIHI